MAEELQAPAIALPQGGGALRGIGETFAPDLHTGTANFAVPLGLPPGRSGLTPSLALSYSSGNGNGPFGLGWTLTAPGVSRKTSTGVPRYDATDIYLLSGMEDLVPVPGAPAGAVRYRPATEGTFARIERRTGDGADYWEVAETNGLTSRYGRRPGPEVDPVADGSTVRDPDRTTRIYNWRITETVDPFGNRIEYEWRHDPDHATGGPVNESFLYEVRYVDYGPPDAVGFLVRVRFVWDARPDPVVDHRAGFAVRCMRRCRRIETWIGSNRLEPVRVVHLTYLDDPDAGADPAELPLNGVSLLACIQVEGIDGNGSELLPPLEFGYTRFDLDRRRLMSLPLESSLGGALAEPNDAFTDLGSNGLSDVLSARGALRAFVNRGGRFDPTPVATVVPAGIGESPIGLELGDANADGANDLLVRTPSIAGWYEVRELRHQVTSRFHRTDPAPSFAPRDPEVEFVDLDGDGLSDAFRSGTRFEAFFAQAQGWGEVRTVDRSALDGFPEVSFADPRVRFADMDGDGLIDVVVLHRRRVDYWPSLGRGRFGPRMTLANGPDLPFDYDPSRLLLVDLDGDGAADLAYVGPGEVTAWINRSGGSWSGPVRVPGTPGIVPGDRVMSCDLLGTGVAGVLWSGPLRAGRRTTEAFLDPTGGTKPYLLERMDNHRGAVTTITYAPSTRFFLEDERDRRTRWRTRLPFPVQVVASVEMEDVFSEARHTTAYRYRHGHWSGRDREFRGFTHVWERYEAIYARDAEGVAFNQPRETHSWFHIGPIEDSDGDWRELDLRDEWWDGDRQTLSVPDVASHDLRALRREGRRRALRTLRGQLVRREVYGPGGGERADLPYLVEERTVAPLPLPVGQELPSPPAPWQERVFFPCVLATRNTAWERGNDPATRITYHVGHDDAGRAPATVAIALARGRRHSDQAADAEGTGWLVTVTRRTWVDADRASLFVRDRIATETTTEVTLLSLAQELGGPLSAIDIARAAADGSLSNHERVVAHRVTRYDGVAFEGLTPGQVGSRAAPSRVEHPVLDGDVVARAYPNGVPVLIDPAGPNWPAEYPADAHPTLPPLLDLRYQAVADRAYPAGLVCPRGATTLHGAWLGRRAHRRPRRSDTDDLRRLRHPRRAGHRSGRARHGRDHRLPRARADAGHRSQRQPDRSAFHAARVRRHRCGDGQGRNQRGRHGGARHGLLVRPACVG